MINVNATNFRKDVFNYLDQTIKYNQPLTVVTKNGNAIVLSEEDYRGIMETLYIESIPGLKEEIVASMKAPKSEFMPLGNRTLSQFLADTEEEYEGRASFEPLQHLGEPSL